MSDKERSIERVRRYMRAAWSVGHTATAYREESGKTNLLLHDDLLDVLKRLKEATAERDAALARIKALEGMVEPVAAEFHGQYERAEKAEARIERVRELHQWNRVDQYDDILGDWVEEYCTGCHEVWPCATIRALEGDDE